MTLRLDKCDKCGKVAMFSHIIKDGSGWTFEAGQLVCRDCNKEAA